MNNKYQLNLEMDEATASHLRPGTIVKVSDAGKERYLRIEEQINLSSMKGVVTKDFKSLWNAFQLPVKSRASRKRIWTIYLVYAFLRAGALSSFFIRGWRLGVIRRMALGGEEQLGLAPGVRKLADIGKYIDDGVKMISLNFFFRLPQLLVMVIVGFSNVELVLSTIQNFFANLFGTAGAQDWGVFFNNSTFDWSVSLITSLIFAAILSLIITPAVKILEIKYALGLIEYRDFFRLRQIKEAFHLHRKYKFKTIQVYLWDTLLTLFSFLIGLFFSVIPPFILFFYPASKLLLNHWPKYYAYGLLARRLQRNGDLPQQGEVNSQMV